MVTSLIRPSYHQGFYSRERGGIPVYPGLWKDLEWTMFPSLGVMGITTIPDWSGHKRNGTFSGTWAISDWVIGQNGYALDFLGTAEHIDSGWTGVLGGGARSVSFWMKTSTLADRDIIGNGVSFGDGKFNIRVDLVSGSDWSIKVENRPVIPAEGNIRATTHIADGVWHHIVYTLPEGGTSGDGLIYIDGKLEVLTENTNPTSAVDTLESITFRCGDFFEKGHYLGQLDGVLAYSRVLNAGEVMQLFVDPHAMFQFRDRVIGKAPAVAGVLRRNLTLMGAGK